VKAYAQSSQLTEKN